MVEGGRIDHAGHHHDAPALVGDQLAFADAIDAALERVERQGDLLVIVTADHTSGGVAVGDTLDLGALAGPKTSMEELVKRSTKAGEKVPSLEALRSGVQAAYGFTPDDKTIEQARASGPLYVHVRLAHLVSQRAGVGFFDLDYQQYGQKVTHGHEGSLVPVFAAGRGAECFGGTYANTRLAFEMARLLGLPRPGEVIPDFGKKYF
jgi:alkaline phosphatase